MNEIKVTDVILDNATQESSGKSAPYVEVSYTANGNKKRRIKDELEFTEDDFDGKGKMITTNFKIKKEKYKNKDNCQILEINYNENDTTNKTKNYLLENGKVTEI